jgi:hypoxanthine phosphoribosyltransferase
MEYKLTYPIGNKALEEAHASFSQLHTDFLKLSFDCQSKNIDVDSLDKQRILIMDDIKKEVDTLRITTEALAHSSSITDVESEKQRVIEAILKLYTKYSSDMQQLIYIARRTLEIMASIDEQMKSSSTVDQALTKLEAEELNKKTKRGLKKPIKKGRE